MSFLEAGTKYLKTIESYDRLSSVEKIEANHLLLAYEELMKDDCYRLCLTDLHLLLRLTESGQAICLQDPELAHVIFVKTIELSPYNKLVLRHYSEFLNIHGWDLESIQLSKFLKQNQLKEAQDFALKLDIFLDGMPINQFRDPSALTSFIKGNFTSVFSHIAKRYLNFIHQKINSNKRNFTEDMNWLNNKMKLFIPYIDKSDLDILHEFTEKGLAKYITSNEVSFMLFKKNMELEPYNRKVTDKFYKLLSLNRHRQFGY